MESWQRKIITSKLYELIQLTTCNDILLAKLLANDILSQDDIESIKAERTNMDKSMKLYNVCQSRTNGFPALANALQECGQTGALTLIQSEFMKNDPKLIVTSALSLESDKATVSAMSMQSIQKAVDTNEQVYRETFLLNATPDPNSVLYENTIPSQVPFYILRSISNRVVLNPEIFRTKCDDVFVVKGIDQHELTQLANGEPTARSSSQTERLDRRFILWEDDDDFEDICAVAEGRRMVTHLVNVETCFQSSSYDYEDNSNPETLYIVEKSSGYSDVLWNFVLSSNHNKRCFISEDEFVSKIEEDGSRGFCICDSPGMGKSWVLASIARKIATRYPNHIPLLFPLRTMDLNTKSLINPICGLIGMVSSGFQKTLLVEGVLDGSIKLDLFFDGLDEVEEHAVESTIQFIKNVLEMQSNVRVFVTSRPHMRRILERSMGVIAYDIQPFSRENQVSFLEEFWGHELEQIIKAKSRRVNREGIKSRLNEFSEACQSRIEKSLTQEEKDILGIPLHCYLFACVLSKNVEKYATRPASTLEDLLDTSFKLGNMYKEFMTTNFTNGDANDATNFKSYHVWRALSQFSSDLAETFEAVVPFDKSFSEGHILKYGILEMCHKFNNQPKTTFVHRTFAEYLVVELFCELCFKEFLDQKLKMLASLLIKFLFKEACKLDIPFHENLHFHLEFVKERRDQKRPDPAYAIKEPVNKSMPFLLNVLLSTLPSQRICDDLLETLCLQLPPNRFFCTFVYCVKAGYLETMVFLKNILLAEQTKQNLWKIYKPIFQSSVAAGYTSSSTKIFIPASMLVLSAATNFSRCDVVQECVEFYDNCFGENIIRTMCTKAVWYKTALHFALQRGDYALVEYFLRQNVSLDGRSYLYYCLHDTYQDCLKKVEERTRICKLLLKSNTRLMYERAYKDSYELENPLATPRINYRLYVALAKDYPEQIRSTVIETWHNHNVTFKYNSCGFLAQFMHTDDLHELCLFLAEKCPQAFSAEDDATFPLSMFFEHCPNVRLDTVSLILSLVDQSQIIKHANKLLLSACRESSDVYELFLQNGITLDMFANCETLTQCVLQWGNLSLVKYLRSKGIYIDLTTAFTGVRRIPEDRFSSIMNYVLQHDNSEKILRMCFNSIILRLSGSGCSKAFVEDMHELFKHLVHLPNSFNVLTTASQYHPNCRFAELLCCKSIDLTSIKALWKKCLPKSGRLLDQLSNALIIHKAIENKQSFDVILFLVEHKVDYKSKDSSGNTILHLAVKHAGGKKLVQYILDKLEVPVNCVNKEGSTALHYANNWSIANILLEHNADPLVMNIKQEIFISNAAMWRNGQEFKDFLSISRDKFGVTDDEIYVLAKGSTQPTIYMRPNYEYNNGAESFLQTHWNRLVSLKPEIGNDILCDLSYNAEWKIVNTILNNNATRIVPQTLKLVCERALYSNSFETLEIINTISTKYLANSFTQCGSLKMARFLNKLKVNVGTQSSNGETVLHKLRELDVDEFLELVRFIKYECNQENVLYARDKNGQTALESRISAAHQPTPSFIVEEFLTVDNYDVNAKDSKGNSLLMTAMKMWNFVGLQSIEIILKHGANPFLRNHKNEDLLHLAVKSEAVEAVEVCLNLGLLIRDGKKDWFTPLDLVIHTIKNHIGSENPYLDDIFDILLQSILSKAEFSGMQDKKYGNTFLHSAALLSTPEVFHFIVENVIQGGFFKRCFVDNKLGRNRLQVAVANMNILEKTIDLFIDNGVKLNKLDSKGRTLWYDVFRGLSRKTNEIYYFSDDARLRNNLAVARTLIKAGLKPELRDAKRNTLLHLIPKMNRKFERVLRSVNNGDHKEFLEIIKFLHEENLEFLFHISNAKNQLPMHLAARKLNDITEIIEVFKLAHLNFDQADKNGKTILMYAIEGQKDFKTLQMLMGLTQNLDAVDKSGNTFLNYLAKFYGIPSFDVMLTIDGQKRIEENDAFHRVVKYLDSSNFNHMLKKSNFRGHGPAEFAVYHVRHLDPSVLNLLLGNDVTAEQLNTLLHICVKQHANPNIFKYLLERGAKLRMKYVNLLHECCRNGLVSHVEYLLEHGYSVECVDLLGNNCLHYALHGAISLDLLIHLEKIRYSGKMFGCYCNLYELIKMLFNKGCSAAQNNIFGRTPLCIARKMQLSELVTLFQNNQK